MILRWLLGPVCLLSHALLVYGHIDPANWLKLGNLKQEMMTFGLLNFHQKRLRDWSYKVIRFTSKQTIDFRENFPVLLTIELVQNSEYTLKDIAHLSNEYCFILIIAAYLLLWVDIQQTTRIVHQSRLQITWSSATFYNVYRSFMYACIKMNGTKRF